jgi:peroxiredoxin
MVDDTDVMVGDPAPGFVLKDHHNDDFTLMNFRGKKVLLSFHPLAWTKVCAQQMKALDDHFVRFEGLNTVPVGISVDSVPAKHAWARHELKIQKVRLLSDFWPHGGVAKDFGIFREKHGTSERANILVDEDGKIIWFKVYDIPELPDIEEVFAALEGSK